MVAKTSACGVRSKVSRFRPATSAVSESALVTAAVRGGRDRRGASRSCSCCFASSGQRAEDVVQGGFAHRHGDRVGCPAVQGAQHSCQRGRSGGGPDAACRRRRGRAGSPPAASTEEAVSAIDGPAKPRSKSTVPMPRLELGGRPGAGHSPGCDDHHLIRQRVGFFQVLRGQQHGGAGPGRGRAPSPTARTGSPGRGRWSARRGRAPAAGAAAPRPGRAAAASRRSRCAPAGPRRRSARSCRAVPRP